MHKYLSLLQQHFLQFDFNIQQVVLQLAHSILQFVLGRVEVRFLVCCLFLLNLSVDLLLELLEFFNLRD